jgi:hypothetical protein
MLAVLVELERAADWAKNKTRKDSPTGKEVREHLAYITYSRYRAIVEQHDLVPKNTAKINRERLPAFHGASGTYCHKLQEKLRDNSGTKGCKKERDSDVLRKMGPRRDSNARPSA